MLFLHQRVGRRHADHAGVDAGGNRDPRKLVAASVCAVERPGNDERLGEDVGEESESGDDGVDSKIRGVVLEELDLEDVAGLGLLDEERAGEGMSAAEIQAVAICVDAGTRQLAVEPVEALEGDDVARPDVGDRRDVRMPAVVDVLGRDSQSNSRSRSAVELAAAISSSVQRRGVPSWWSERIASSRPSISTGVTICAPRPP